MKRHDKIFAMECTNTCHANSRLNGHYCNFRLTLKKLDLNKENMLKSKLLLSYVGREKKNRNLNVPKKASRRNVFCQFYDDLMF